MSKPRRTPIPLPGSKSKITPPAPKGALSQEFVDDSDDSAPETAQAKKSTPKKAAVTIAVHRPKNGVVKETTPKKASKKQKEKEATKSAPKAKAPEVKKPAPKQVEVEEDGASSSSSEEDDSEEDPETDIKKAQKREQEKTKASASSSDSESASDSSSEEESDEPAPAPTPEAVESQSKPTPSKSHAVDFVAARPYVPPKDYHPTSTARAQTTAPTNLFTSLSGKQIWHITAPSTISLKSLKELVSMDQALKNATPILTHKSTNYAFTDLSQQDTPTGSAPSSKSAAVIVPAQNGYTPISLPISHTLHIRELVSLPALSSLQADPNTGSEAAASITRSTIRAPRPQLKGLKMRYFPSGVGERTPVVVGSDDEDEDEDISVAGPSGKKSKKSKGTDAAEGEAGLSVPKVKHVAVGKRKLDVDEDAEVPAKKVKKVRGEGEKKDKNKDKAKKEKKKKVKA